MVYVCIINMFIIVVIVIKSVNKLIFFGWESVVCGCFGSVIVIIIVD